MQPACGGIARRGCISRQACLRASTDSRSVNVHLCHNALGQALPAAGWRGQVWDLRCAATILQGERRHARVVIADGLVQQDQAVMVQGAGVKSVPLGICQTGSVTSQAIMQR